MTQYGIEAINVYGGATYIDVRELFEARGLDLARFDNLMMEKKSVSLPCEDPITNALNAAKPIVDDLSEQERHSIELLITSTESGIDFGKSLSTYIHDYLGLSRQCRLFEIKQACYGGTAALQMAVNTIIANVNPSAKALVIATDSARAVARHTYFEPSQGVAAVAMLVSAKPTIFALDVGAYGLHSYEVMDTCRPKPDLEMGDNDLSLLSYLDCFENSYAAYANKIEDVDFETTFDYLAFHTPFPGMVKGAHRKLFRQLKPSSLEFIEADLQRRVSPSFIYCCQVGNVYSATTYLALCSLIDHATINSEKRIGVFSYGSGCSSEFYSGTVTPESKETLAEMQLQSQLDHRYQLSIEEYDKIVDLNETWMFGVENKTVDNSPYQTIYNDYIAGRRLLTLSAIKGYHREYVWS